MSGTVQLANSSNAEVGTAANPLYTSGASGAPNVTPFAPLITSTVGIPATTSSARQQLPAAARTAIAAGTALQLQIYNPSANGVRVNWGDATVIAAVASGATPGDYPVAKGSTVIVTISNTVTYVAAITDTGTATVEFTVGSGQ